MVRTSGVATQGNKDTAYRNASREAKPDILKIHVPIWTGRTKANGCVEDKKEYQDHIRWTSSI